MFATASVLLALTITICADDKSPATETPEKQAGSPQIVEWYDQTKNVILLTVNLDTVRLGENDFTASIYRWYRGKGRLGAAYGAVAFLFRSDTRVLEPKYQEDHGTVITADSQAVRIERVEYGNHKVPDRANEFIRVNIGDDAALRRLASARSVEGTVGPDSFRFTPAQVATLQDFVRHVLDPRLPINRKSLTSRPGASPRPDRGTIPKGQGILWVLDGSVPCPVVREVRAIDELESTLLRGVDSFQDTTFKIRQQEREGLRVSVPCGTPVRVLEKLERPRSRGLSRWLTKVEVLDGPAKGVIGWCIEDDVITSLKDPSDRDAHIAEAMWSRAEQQEKDGKIEAALGTYRDLVKSNPKTPWAKQAAERIKAFSGK